MAKSLYDIRNYPQRGGSSQNMRSNPVLMGHRVSLDERTLADYMVFAQRLAKFLTYYDSQGLKSGDWQLFLKNDISYQLARSLAEKSSQWARLWNELMEPIETDTNEEYRKYLTLRFDALYSMMAGIMEAFAASGPLSGWHSDLLALLTTQQLNVIWFMLQAYHAECNALLTTVDPYSFAGLTLDKAGHVKATIETYSTNTRSVLVLEQPLFADASFIFGTATTLQEKVSAASEYLDELAGQLVAITAGENQLADQYLSVSLSSFTEHSPHVALFYAFLQLAGEHQTEMNGLMLKHLDFYYRDVLQAREKAWQAPRAFVHFELAKNSLTHFVPSGTALDGGKDAGGKAITFFTKQDLLVNKAAVDKVMSSTYIANPTAQTLNVRPNLGLFACPQANSADGLGKALQPGESWPPFRVDSTPNDAVDGFGLAFYAPLLNEAPGEIKSFTLTLLFASNKTITDVAVNMLKQYGELKFFTDKDPVYIPLTNIVREDNGFKISFTLGEETKLTSKTGPNASIIVGHKSGAVNNIFNDVVVLFQTASIVSLNLSFDNTSVEVNNVETAAGTTDVSSAFPAFGGLPKPGSTFLVKAPILYNRLVSRLWLQIDWASLTERQQQWTVSFAGQTPTDKTIESGKESTITKLIESGSVHFVNSDAIKCTLKAGLGHLEYATEYTGAVLRSMKVPMQEAQAISSPVQQKAMVQKEGVMQQNDLMYHMEAAYMVNVGQAVNAFPSPPYTPVIKKITLNVQVRERVDVNNPNAIRLYHQYPFGYKPIANFAQARLIPGYSNEGELYIGFRDLQPGQNLHLLVQVEEGSADSSLDNPQTQWQYLYDNCWYNFDSALFSDDTKGLIQSGIVRMVWPEKDCTKNTLLPEGLCWLKAAVPFNQTLAVCNILGLHTQAIEASFSNNSNTEAWLGTNLPPATISKLVQAQPQVKKVTQPYATIGGRLTETPDAFYTRSSERLRHKQRAVSIWDYEHIILEAFPGIYKVKVLNHAHFDPITARVTARPGEVLILPVARTSARSAIYKPLVSKSELNKMADFIQALASPFIKITVMNALYEDVRVVANVTGTPVVKDRIYYQNLLVEDVNRFLSPWAYDGSAEPAFGGTIYQSALLDFIEELPYVDFVSSLELHHAGSPTLQEAAATSPASILMAAPIHDIYMNQGNTNNFSTTVTPSNIG